MKVKVEINEIKDKDNKTERINQFRNLYLEDIYSRQISWKFEKKEIRGT